MAELFKPKKRKGSFVPSSQTATGPMPTPEMPVVKRVNPRFKIPTEGTSQTDLAKSTGHFDSGVAPRVGGKATATQGGVPIGGTKKSIIIAKRNVNKSAASPQAKRAARMSYRRRG